MNDDVAAEYDRLEQQFKDIFKYQREISKKVLSAYLGLLTVYPDQPYDHKPIVHPIYGDDLVVPRDTSSFEELHEKDRHVLEVVERKVAAGVRVLIYTSWVRIDSQEKLSKLLMEQGYRVSILTTAIQPNKREEWVERQVQSGVQVLITNPSLVETGLDLNDFTTLYYYNISYNLFTLRQSSRRSWRINQRAPRESTNRRSQWSAGRSWSRHNEGYSNRHQFRDINTIKGNGCRRRKRQYARGAEAAYGYVISAVGRVRNLHRYQPEPVTGIKRQERL
jgi:hypothetical protein